MGIQIRQQGNELFKFSVILFGLVYVGNGFALHQLLQGINGSLAVKFHCFIGDRGLLFGEEESCPQQNHCQKQGQQP